MYQPILRAEIEEYLDLSEPRSWSRAALSRCVKLDSFLKESLRINGNGALWIPRKSVQSFSLSDSTHIPAGHFMALPARAIHHDPNIYERPEIFDGLRFYAKQELHNDSGCHMMARDEQGEEEDLGRNSMTSPSPSYIAFGGGRHLW
jgi:cytochrome P450